MNFFHAAGRIATSATGFAPNCRCTSALSPRPSGTKRTRRISAGEEQELPNSEGFGCDGLVHSMGRAGGDNASTATPEGQHHQDCEAQGVYFEPAEVLAGHWNIRGPKSFHVEPKA